MTRPKRPASEGNLLGETYRAARLLVSHRLSEEWLVAVLPILDSALLHRYLEIAQVTRFVKDNLDRLHV